MTSSYLSNEFQEKSFLCRDASCSRLETHLTSYDSNDSSREDISSNSSGKSEMNDFRGYSMSPLMRENFSPGIHYSGNYSSYIGKHKNGLITFGDTIEAVRLSVGLCKYIIFNAANSLRS
jgi:hypothetical protein